MNMSSVVNVSNRKRNFPLVILLAFIIMLAVWLYHPGDMLHGISEAEVEEVILLCPAGEPVPLAEEEASQLIELFARVRLWGFRSYYLDDYDGLQTAMFRIRLNTGKIFDFSAGGGWYVLDGVGYRAGYDAALGNAISSQYDALSDAYTGHTVSE